MATLDTVLTAEGDTFVVRGGPGVRPIPVFFTPQEADSARAYLAQHPCDASADTVPTYVSEFLTNSRALENEVHDCQRLVVVRRRERSFGPLVGLFPIEGAMSLPRDSYTQPVAVATIYNWDAASGSDYGALYIGATESCLWLRNTDGSEEGWRAAIDTLRAESCWQEVTPPPDGAFRLEVHEMEHSGARTSQYPETARWGWDRDNELHYIGVRCADRWCAIGSPDFRHQDRLGGADIRRSIPGWFDAQHLAVYDSASGRLRPGPWGILYPRPELRYFDLGAWSTGLPVADIVVEGRASDRDVQYYMRKLNLTSTGQQARGTFLVQLTSLTEGSASYVNGAGVERAALNFRVTHYGAHGPPMGARWRWMETDESPWVGCRGGCCWGDGTE